MRTRDRAAPSPGVPGPGGETRLPRDFFAAGARELARRLLGCRLVRVLNGGQRLSVRIVETEAYLGVTDRAAHSFGGRRTARNEVMYGPPGMAYVYFVYGMHHCFNVVCGALGDPVAVLVRAGEPCEGIESMRRRRGLGARADDWLLASGPARLCEAMAIGRDLNGEDLAHSSAVWVERWPDETPAPDSVVVTARVGIDYAGEWAGRHLRWLVRDNRHVSRPPGASPRRSENQRRRRKSSKAAGDRADD